MHAYLIVIGYCASSEIQSWIFYPFDQSVTSDIIIF